MNLLRNTYHYYGPLNARRQLATRPNPGWQASAGSGLTTGFASTVLPGSTTNFASGDARGMRQHGHFGLA
jgi:hypothetical protein